MDYLHSAYNSIVAILGGILGFLFGGLNGVLIALLCFIVMDFVTGVLTGIAEKNLSSDTAFKGLVMKFYELLIVSAAHMLDVYILKNGETIATAVCFLFISTEGISLLENAARLGVPIPKKVISILSQLKVTSGGIATKEDFNEAKSDTTEKGELNNETLTLNESTDKEVEKE